MEIAGLKLTVTRMDGPRIIQVGLLLPRAEPGATMSGGVLTVWRGRPEQE
ncbi:hypothetical protein ACU4GD_25470 [Cupriavidus basilensis]